MSKPYISEIVINNFRNYSSKKFTFDSNFNIITGPNGSGKSSLLEAIYFFNTLKSFRGTSTEELINSVKDQITLLPKDILFSLYITITDSALCEKVSIIYKHDISENKKEVKIDDRPIKKLSELNDIFKISYLIPQMNQFFIGPSASRRKFLDKTASLLYTNHYTVVSRYEFFLKERLRILTLEKPDLNWLDIVEKKISELGVSIASIRNEIVDNFNNIFNTHKLCFPICSLEINGEIETKLRTNKALVVEHYFMEKLKTNREEDRNTKRTNFGIHKSDLEVIHKMKGIKASLCSTGEQKLLLISLIIIRCIFTKNLDKGISILLLDEATTHLDYKTRELFLHELKKLDIQTFITSITSADLQGLEGKNITL